MTARLLVIGSGMATARLLECLAARGCSDRVTVVGDESSPSYNRVLLPGVLSGDAREEDLALLEPGWYRRHGVRLLTGTAVTRVDPLTRTAWTASGQRIPFDRLVFATGSRAHMPAIPGARAAGVLGFRSLADLDAIRSHAAARLPAVVVGGGLLGLEAAHGLRGLGLGVTVLHRHPHLMNRQLDATAGQLLARTLEGRGIAFALGAHPLAIELRDGRAGGVRLADGRLLEAGIVVFAAGIDANCELAAAAGVPCGRGIRVDRWLRTALPDIYACGECCESEGRTVGLVSPVHQQAEVLADVLAGRDTPGFAHVETPTQLKVSGIEVFSAGVLQSPAGAEEQVLRDESRGIYRRLVFADGRLVTAMLLGDARGGRWYGELIAQGRDVSAWRARMMFGREFCEEEAALHPGVRARARYAA